MTKNHITTRRTSPRTDAAEEMAKVTSTESKVVEPKLKRIVPEPEVVPEEALAAPQVVRPMTVELVEGSSYELRGVRFYAKRPVVVVDERLLSELKFNSRFKVTGVGGD